MDGEMRQRIRDDAGHDFTVFLENQLAAPLDDELWAAIAAMAADFKRRRKWNELRAERYAERTESAA
jgi:hypothetical protein